MDASLRTWSTIGFAIPACHLPGHLCTQEDSAEVQKELKRRPVLPQDPDELLWRWVVGQCFHSRHIKGDQEVGLACSYAGILLVEGSFKPRLVLDYDDDCSFWADVLVQPPAAESRLI